jgi:hypothetical protein
VNRAGTIVDSSVLLDVFTEDPRWLAWSEEQLISAAQRGTLILNAVVLAEIAPRFTHASKRYEQRCPRSRSWRTSPPKPRSSPDTRMRTTDTPAARVKPCSPTFSSAPTPPSRAGRCSRAILDASRRTSQGPRSSAPLTLRGRQAQPRPLGLRDAKFSP